MTYSARHSDGNKFSNLTTGTRASIALWLAEAGWVIPVFMF